MEIFFTPVISLARAADILGPERRMDRSGGANEVSRPEREAECFDTVAMLDDERRMLELSGAFGC